MPQALLVFAVYFTPETPNFGTFIGVAHPLEEFSYFYKVFVLFFFKCVYTHIWNKNYEKKLILKKIDFRVKNLLKILYYNV